MAHEYALLKQLIRAATEDETRRPLDDGETATVYAALRDLQDRLRGICEEGRVLTSSEVGRSKFAFALTGAGEGPEKWLALTERALEHVEACTTITQVRSILKRVRSTGLNFQACGEGWQ